MPGSEYEVGDNVKARCQKYPGLWPAVIVEIIHPPTVMSLFECARTHKVSDISEILQLEAETKYVVKWAQGELTGFSPHTHTQRKRVHMCLIVCVHYRYRYGCAYTFACVYIQCTHTHTHTHTHALSLVFKSVKCLPFQSKVVVVVCNKRENK